MSTSGIISWLNQLLIRSGLTSTRAIRLQLAVLLHLMRIDDNVCYHYKSRFKFINEHEDSATIQSGPRVAPFPLVPNFILRYQTFSTAILIPCFIKNTFPEHLNRLLVMLYDSSGDGKLAGLPAACIVPGRLIFHRVLRYQFGTVLSGFNLFYRFYVWYARKPYIFGLVDALVQEESELENFYHLLAGAAESSSSSGRRIAEHPFSQFMCYQVEVPTRWHVSHKPHDYTLQGQHAHRLRPNMSREVCARYKLYIAYSFLFMILTMGWLLLIAGTGFALLIALDWGYLYNYPDCDEHLEHLYATSQLPWYSVTLTPHRCIMVVFDVIENVVIYFDSGLTILALFPLLIVLNNHVVCHWRQLHKRIVATVQQLRFEQHRKVSSAPVSPLLRLMRCCRGPGRGAAVTLAQRTLAELRAGMRDFFDQVAHMDVLASDIMSMSFLMWLVALLVIANRAFTYYLTHPDFFSLLGFTFPTVFLAGMPFAAAPTTLVSFILFGLNTNCVRTYGSLCALVAYQEPLGEKSRFSAEMMEYFVHQDRICYKILRTYPFKATSYFKLVSWAATSLALLASMVNHSA